MSSRAFLDTTVSKPRGNASQSETGLPALDRILPMLRTLGPQGFVLINNLGTFGPEYHYSGYPADWQRTYERRGFLFFDPVLLWALRNVGNTRWSAIEWPDPLGIMATAEKVGIRFGAIFARGGVLAQKTILSVARGDREFTDEEVLLIAGLLDTLVSERLDPTLNDPELDTLRLRRDGLSLKEIAREQDVSVSTVKLRLTSARRKLGTTSNTRAVTMAMHRKLI